MLLKIALASTLPKKRSPSSTINRESIMDQNNVRIGGNPQNSVDLQLRMANRHGLITGATGTGKTVTLQVMAEGFARAGVPVFLADAKGDLSGLARSGAPNDRIQQRITQLNLQHYNAHAYSTLLCDLHGRREDLICATVSDMGPMLSANLLELNET
jgi:DNA helicase HerA-like ATPase